MIYNIFVRDFRKQKKRITLTLIALAWGTISIMLLLGFGEGLHQQLTINRRGMGENIVVLWAGSTSLPYKGLPKGRELRFQAEDIDYLRRSMPELEEVGGEYSQWGVEVRYGENVVSEHITGITPNYETIRNHIPLMGGRMINEIDLQKKRRVVFLGSSIAGRLFGREEGSESSFFGSDKPTTEDPVGKTVYINGLPFTVIGVEREKQQMGMYGGPDGNKASIPLTTFETVFGHRYVHNIIYKPADPTRMEQIERRVYEVFGAKYKFDPNDDRALWVWDTVTSSAEFDKILTGLKMFLGIIGGLTLLIAGVGVANIMYVSVKERTREIGIKMACGARRSYVMVQFLIEALIITFLGGVGGMSVSYILTESFKRLPMESDVLRFMGRPTIDTEIGITVIIILGIMGILSGLFPAMRASSVNPVESLRYE